MPTQSNTYNSRVTDEALEKRFRDTFKAQGGAELVDDLYAQGVIVPVVDFTAAATGQQLGTDLQTAMDFSTGLAQFQGNSGNIVSNSGFWRVQGVITRTSQTTPGDCNIQISDGLSSKTVFSASFAAGSAGGGIGQTSYDFIVFLRSGDTLTGSSSDSAMRIDVSYRQIATVSGDLVNPSGFVSS